jgi:hypothetical protein
MADNKYFVIAILLGTAFLLIVQAVFSSQIGNFKAGRVRYYPPFLRWFFEVFPPDSELVASLSLIAAIVGTVVCVGFAMVIWFYVEPSAR